MPDTVEDISLWSAAWKVWINIGTNATKPPEKSEAGSGEKVYVPSQNFLTALIHTFPPLFDHLKARFTTSDMQQFSKVLHAALSVPVHGDASPFIIPSYPDVTITPLQESSLLAMDSLIKVILHLSVCMCVCVARCHHHTLTGIFFNHGNTAPVSVRVCMYTQM